MALAAATVVGNGQNISGEERINDDHNHSHSQNLNGNGCWKEKNGDIVGGTGKGSVGTKQTPRRRALQNNINSVSTYRQGMNE